MRSKRLSLNSAAESDVCERLPGLEQAGHSSAEDSTDLRKRIRIDLELKGVARDVSETLAGELVNRASELTGDCYDNLLEGVAMACRMQSGADLEIMRNACEAREAERMVRAFAGELSKLDETLEVLAAYVARMRSNLDSEETGTVH